MSAMSFMRNFICSLYFKTSKNQKMSTNRALKALTSIVSLLHYMYTHILNLENCLPKKKKPSIIFPTQQRRSFD